MSDIFQVDFYAKDWLLDTQALSLEERGAFIQIVSAIYARQGPVEYDARWLANLCNCSVRKIRSIVSALCQREFMSVDSDNNIRQERAENELEKAQKRSEKASNNARKSHENNAKTSRKSDNDDANMADGSSEIEAKSNKNSDLTSANTNTNTNKKKNNKKNGYSDAFEEWYERYPHKVGKADAYRAYQTARKHVDQQTLLNGVEHYKRTKPPDIRYCNPATWLNQERWLDQPSPDAEKPPRNQTNQPAAKQSEKSLPSPAEWQF